MGRGKNFALAANSGGVPAARFDAVFGAKRGRDELERGDFSELYSSYHNDGLTNRLARELQHTLTARPELLAEALGSRTHYSIYDQDEGTEEGLLIGEIASSFCVKAQSGMENDAPYLWRQAGYPTVPKEEEWSEHLPLVRHDATEFSWRQRRAFLECLADEEGTWTAARLLTLAHRHYANELVTLSADCAVEYPDRTLRRIIPQNKLHDTARGAGLNGVADLVRAAKRLPVEHWRLALTPLAETLAELSEEFADPERNHQALSFCIAANRLDLAIPRALREQIKRHKRSTQ